MASKLSVASLLLIAIAGLWMSQTVYPILVNRPVHGNGNCYTLEGFQLRQNFKVFIDSTNMPGGINFGADVSGAIAEYNSHTHFVLYTLTTNQAVAQLVVGFGQVGSSSELGVASINWELSTGTVISATITLDQTKSWSDNTIFATSFNVEHVLLHEFGHVIGLNHVDQSCDDVMDPYTYPGAARETLGVGDIAGEQMIYGS